MNAMYNAWASHDFIMFLLIVFSFFISKTLISITSERDELKQENKQLKQKLGR